MATKRPNPLTDRIARAIQASDAWKLGQGVADAIGQTASGVHDYAYSRTPEQFAGDVIGLGLRAADGSTRAFLANPNGYIGDQVAAMNPLPPILEANRRIQQAKQTDSRADWQRAGGDMALAMAGVIPGAGGKGKAAARVLKEGEALLRDAEGIAQIGHNMAPTTKKALATESRYLPPGQKPIVTQAGERREPLGGREQFNAQHPSAFTPFHNIKPSVDPAEVTATHRPFVDMAPPRMLTPADLEGAYALSLTGDRSMAGKELTGINGLEFAAPVEAHGGPDYGWMQSALGSNGVWASEPIPVAQMRKSIERGLNEGRDVYGVTTAMGPQSLDQTTMMTDTLARMIQAGGLGKREIKAFDQMANDEKWNLPSVGNTDELIDVLGRKSQRGRLDFVEAMDKGPWLKAGFPDVGSARMALTDPNLQQMPAGASGYRVVKFGPETLKAMEDPYLPHGSYSEVMAGQLAGGYDELVPFDLMFPDWVQARRAEGAPYGSDLRSLDLAKPMQLMTPEAVDRLMLFRSGAQKRRR